MGLRYHRILSGSWWTLPLSAASWGLLGLEHVNPGRIHPATSFRAVPCTTLLCKSRLMQCMLPAGSPGPRKCRRCRSLTRRLSSFSPLTHQATEGCGGESCSQSPVQDTRIPVPRRKGYSCRSQYQLQVREPRGPKVHPREQMSPSHTAAPHLSAPRPGVLGVLNRTIKHT